MFPLLLSLVLLFILLPASVRSNEPACWTNGLSYELCCFPWDTGGNRLCWDGVFTFQWCCNTFEDVEPPPSAEYRARIERLKRVNATAHVGVSLRKDRGSPGPRSSRDGTRPSAGSSSHEDGGSLSKEDRELLQHHYQHDIFLAKQEEEEGLACAAQMYQQFKFETAQYWNRNVTHWTMLQTQGYIVNQFAHIAKMCAPAALAALLLKLESIYFRKDGKFEDTLRVYSTSEEITPRPITPTFEAM